MCGGLTEVREMRGAEKTSTTSWTGSNSCPTGVTRAVKVRASLSGSLMSSPGTAASPGSPDEVASGVSRSSDRVFVFSGRGASSYREPNTRKKNVRIIIIVGDTLRKDTSKVQPKSPRAWREVGRSEHLQLPRGWIPDVPGSQQPPSE